jgi:hypothetical protein
MVGLVATSSILRFLTAALERQTVIGVCPPAPAGRSICSGSPQRPSGARKAPSSVRTCSLAIHKPDFGRWRQVRQRGPEDDISAQRPAIGDYRAREMAAKAALLLADLEALVSVSNHLTTDTGVPRAFWKVCQSFTFRNLHSAKARGCVRTRRRSIAIEQAIRSRSFFVPTSQANSILKSHLRISFSSRFEFLSFRTA